MTTITCQHPLQFNRHGAVTYSSARIAKAQATNMKKAQDKNWGGGIEFRAVQVADDAWGIEEAMIECEPCRQARLVEIRARLLEIHGY